MLSAAVLCRAALTPFFSAWGGILRGLRIAQHGKPEDDHILWVRDRYNCQCSCTAALNPMTATHQPFHLRTTLRSPGAPPRAILEPPSHFRGQVVGLSTSKKEGRRYQKRFQNQKTTNDLSAPSVSTQKSAAFGTWVHRPPPPAQFPATPHLTTPAKPDVPPLATPFPSALQRGSAGDRAGLRMNGVHRRKAKRRAVLTVTCLLVAACLPRSQIREVLPQSQQRPPRELQRPQRRSWTMSCKRR